jgi:Abnormal spindle-like microcephaly-assoc'd, ASPM-SPD-2-Hydin
MKRTFGPLLCAVFLLSSCGGGSMGNGIPIASLSTTSLNFGDQVAGTTSGFQPVTLTNSGTAALSITSIVASGNFAESNACGSSLQSEANCTINVSFSPGSTGNINGTVSITDNATGSPQMISLTGVGTAPSPGGKCSIQGQQCGAPQLPPCCSGLTCSAASARAFCQP